MGSRSIRVSDEVYEEIRRRKKDKQWSVSSVLDDLIKKESTSIVLDKETYARVCELRDTYMLAGGGAVVKHLLERNNGKLE